MNRTHRRAPWLLRVALAAALMVAGISLSTQTANAWVIGHWGIYNMGTTSIGVVHTARSGPYNGVLPVGRSTYGYFGWAYATGFYTGAGWCTNYYTAGWSD